MKRCEYAFSQDATQLLELKLVEIEAASKGLFISYLNII